MKQYYLSLRDVGTLIQYSSLTRNEIAMQKYYATALRDTDFPLSASVYLASEVDAVFARIRELITTDHESKEDFINRVRLCLPTP